MIRRSYDALLLDLDGTLLADDETIHPRTLAALRAAHAAGVRVIVATGRSELAAAPVLDELGFDAPALVYNGAAIYSRSEDRLVEERVLSDRTAALALELGERQGLLMVAMRSGAKFSLPPRDEFESKALQGMHGLQIVEEGGLPAERLIRVTYFSRDVDPATVSERIRLEIGQPVYTTHFRLALLAQHRESPLSVVDLHPPCRGKAEALRFLLEHHAIPEERIVAVGDASNDLPMLEDAGLGVAMQRSVPEVLAVADRVIGDNNSDAIGALVEELFGLETGV